MYVLPPVMLMNLQLVTAYNLNRKPYNKEKRILAADKNRQNALTNGDKRISDYDSKKECFIKIPTK